MQKNNNNSLTTIDPELKGSVDFDFFSNEDEVEERNKENLSTIDEADAASRNSNDNSLKSGSIGELGGSRDRFDVTDKPPRRQVVKRSNSNTSSSSDPSTAPSSPTNASSNKSASTVRSGGFPPMPRGDSTRPQSPTPPSSHESPSPHRIASAPRSTSPPQRSPRSNSTHSRNSRDRSISPIQSSDHSLSSQSSRSRTPSSPRKRKSSSSSRSRSPSTSRRSNRSKSPPATSRLSRSPSPSPSPSSSSSSSASRSSSSKRGKEHKKSSDHQPRHSRRRKRSNRSSVSSEDSDVTDVSPLSSKQHSPMGSPPPPVNRRPPPPDAVPIRLHKDRARYNPQSGNKAPPNGDNETDVDQMNVELIMKAILELDRERQGTHPSYTRRSQRCQSAKDASGRQDKNYSFTSDRVNQIESENRRLLERLLNQESRRSVRKGTGSRPLSAQTTSSLKGATMHRPYHSTINRIREQRRIEEENRSILKRLSKVRPTPNMTRDQQLRDYQRQNSYGAFPVGAKARRAPPTVAPMPLEEHSSFRFRSHSRDRIMSGSSSIGGGGGRGRGRARSNSAMGSERAPKGLTASARPEWPSGW